MGSVKDLMYCSGPAKGDWAFLFSDKYSVFDYGEMPDLIPGKGAALG